ncbi:uncharacterized protein [Physcomitrium patens]|uniref:uncharacterized protein isoform X1 n=1 Tax=Physcomitrium patens TaxID=3218 RepID=UPI003CCC990C
MGKSVDKMPPPANFSTSNSAMSSQRNDLASRQPPVVSEALPLSIHYTEKFELLGNGLCQKRGPGRNQFLSSRAPAAVELLNAEGASKFNVDGGLTDNAILREGEPMPKEIIAVVRPRNIFLKKQEGKYGRTDQQSILPDEMEMNLEVKVFDFAPPETDVLKTGKDTGVVYSGKTKATVKQDVQGLYCFQTQGNQLEHLFTQMGTYMFHFSLVSSKYKEVPPAVVRINVAPSNTDMCDARCLEQPKRKRRRPREDTSEATIQDGSLDVAPIDDGLEDDFEEPPHIVNTKIHVTTLDVIVSFQAATTLAPARLECWPQINAYRSVFLWEITSFGFFLFSTLVAHGFKLYIVLENGKDRENSNYASVSQRFLQYGILSCSLGSILGAIALIVSMVILIEVRLGALFCGNPWAVFTTVPFVLLAVTGCAIFIVSVFYQATKDSDTS